MRVEKRDVSSFCRSDSVLARTIYLVANPLIDSFAITSGPEVECRLDIEIRPYDIVHESTNDWSRFGDFLAEYSKEFWPGDPPMDRKTWESAMQADSAENDLVAYEAVDAEQNEKIAGFFRLLFWKDSSPSYKGNEHICNMPMFSVRREYRRRGIAAKLLSVLYDEVRERGRQSIVGQIMNEAGRVLVRSIGGKEALAMQDNRLNLDSVDWDMVKAWVKEGPKRSPGTRIVFFHSIPDTILGQYCDVYTEVGNQAPREQLKVGDEIVTPESWRNRMEKLAEAGMKYLAALTIEKNGDISGLTDVAWLPVRPSILNQWLTGVQEKYRGKGLGKWLKGAVLLKVKKEFPTVTSIQTGNATSNEPMLDINRRLGFKMYRQIYLCQIELDELEMYLKK